jgi:hypothetical protein
VSKVRRKRFFTFLLFLSSCETRFLCVTTRLPFHFNRPRALLGATHGGVTGLRTPAVLGSMSSPLQRATIPDQHARSFSASPPKPSLFSSRNNDPASDGKKEHDHHGSGASLGAAFEAKRESLQQLQKLCWSVNDFKFLQRLGRGRVSTVYRAQHVSTRMDFALKCYYKVGLRSGRLTI